MARVKVRLADNIARVVFLETDATVGAVLGTNLFMPNGDVATPNSLAQWLGITTGGRTTFNHRELAGLRLGNDHPQYPLKAGTETISGLWDFTQYVTINNNAGLRVSNTTVPGAGLRFTADGTDAVNGTNATIEFREGADDTMVYGFRTRLEGSPDNEAYFDFYAHNNSAAGVRFFRAYRTTAAIDAVFSIGALGAPSISFATDADLGFFRAGANTLGISAQEVDIRNPSGVTSPNETALALRNDGTNRFSVIHFETPAGTRAVTFGYGGSTSTLPNQGFLNMPTSADFLFRTGGTERWRLSGNGAMGFSGANYGSSGNFLRSNGSTGPPSWQTAGLADLSQVNLAGLASGQVLGWNGSNWVPTNPGEVNTASNLGAGTGLYASKSGVDLRFKSLVAGTNVTITSDANTVTVASTGGGGGSSTLDGLTDVDTYGAEVSDVLTWDGTQWIALPAPGAAGGEANTASNLGSGTGLFASKVSVDLRFKSLVAGAGVAISSDSTTVTITADPTMDELSDVNVSTLAPRVGDMLVYDGTNWVTRSPRNQFYLFEDFMFLPGTTPSGGWDLFNTGAGSGIAAQAVQGAPGVVRLTSGTASDGYATIMYGSDYSATSAGGIVIGGGEIIFRARVRWVGTTYPSNTTAGNALARIGLSNETAGAPTDGCYFATDGVTASGAYAGEWVGATRNTASGLSYDQDTAVAIAGDTWVLLEMRISADGTTATFYVNGTLIATTTANMPAGVALRPHAQIQRAAAIGTSYSIDVDYIEVIQNLTTARQ